MKKIILLLFTGSFVLGGCSSSAYNEDIKAGDTALKENHYSDAINNYNKALQEKSDDTIAKNKINQTNKKYADNLNAVVKEILEESVLCAKQTESYSNVWRDSIKWTLDESRFSESMGINASDLTSYDIKPEDMGYYAFQGDFDNAIKKAGEYFEKSGSTKNIQDMDKKITNDLKNLASPIDIYKDVYNDVVQLYSNEQKYSELAISPTGSLITYNQDANQLSSDIVSKAAEIQVKLPK